MHIYVDESGSFVVPAGGGHRIVGVVGLVIPSGQKAALFRRFRKLKKSWPGGGGEVKGSSLAEQQVAQAIRLLAEFDVMAQALLTDMGSYTSTELRDYQAKQADMLTEHLTTEYAPDVIAETERQREECLALPLQLFAQAMLTIHLLDDVMHMATIFHAFRFPPELGQFDWVIDAKDQKITAMERLWSTLMMPMIETEGFTKPFIRVREGNYRAFKRFEFRESELPLDQRRHIEWVKSKTPRAQEADYAGVDFGKIFKNLTFRNSKDEPGLQLADIVASALCRAFNRNLQIDGWGEIGSLFVNRSGPELGPSLRLVRLDPTAKSEGEELGGYHRRVALTIMARAKEMFPESPAPGGQRVQP